MTQEQFVQDAGTPTPPKQPGCLLRLVGGLLTAGFASAAIGGGALYWHYQQFLAAPVLAEGQVIALEIPRGTSWPGVVNRVRDAGLVRWHHYFNYWGREAGLPATVRAGNYELKGPLTLEGLAAELRRGGMAEETEVTFPEGFTIFHIADRVAEAKLATREEFLSAARDPALMSRLGATGESFEGYLFPDTYRFKKGTTAVGVIERMNARWKEVWTEIEAKYPEALERMRKRYNFGPHEVVTLASLVERETGVDSERPMVARVFLNRLDRKMKLQTDPTCVYGEATYHLIPTGSMCRDPKSRYSTYVIDGLTPGPIANPGRESLDAALSPDQTAEANDFLYFVAMRDGTGRHFFTKNFDDHRQAIKKYLLSPAPAGAPRAAPGVTVPAP